MEKRQKGRVENPPALFKFVKLFTDDPVQGDRVSTDILNISFINQTAKHNFR